MSDLIKSPSEGYKNNAYIHTQDGRFYAARPTWSLNAVAHSLAQTARYRGHLDEQYSVAEHGVLVSLIVEDYLRGTVDEAFEGLHHDDTEYVLPDVSSPFKQLFPDLKAFDKNILEPSMRAYWGLPAGAKSQIVQKADWLALFIESAQALPERGVDFEDPYNIRHEAMNLRERGWRIQALPWREAKEAYIDRHRDLDARRKSN